MAQGFTVFQRCSTLSSSALYLHNSAYHWPLTHSVTLNMQHCRWLNLPREDSVYLAKQLSNVKVFVLGRLWHSLLSLIPGLQRRSTAWSASCRPTRNSRLRSVIFFWSPIGPLNQDPTGACHPSWLSDRFFHRATGGVQEEYRTKPRRGPE